MTADLKPCPFCGMAPSRSYGGRSGNRIWCANERCQERPLIAAETWSGAASIWNIRASTVSDTGPGTSGLRTPQPGEAPVSDAPATGWQPIATAPDLERVIVAGWQPRSGTVAGYWWYHEDHTDEHGVPMEHPSARLWVGLSAILPPLPAPPVDSSAAPSTPVDNKISADPVGKEG